MINPEKMDLRLNFTNLFKKSKQPEAQSRDPPLSNRSQVITPRHQRLSHHTRRFIPRCPYQRSVSVNGQRKSKQKIKANEQYGIFSIKAFQNKSASFFSETTDTKQNGGKKLVIISLKNNSLPLKSDKFQIYKSALGPDETKTKIRGLRIRTGSSLAKNRLRVEFDCDNVMVKGQKIQRK